MSTRCHIGKLQDDGTVKYIYCHYDGYLEGVGETLKEYYTSEDSVRDLLDLGDISSLGRTLEECDPYSDDEEDCPASIRQNVDAYFFNSSDWDIDYMYLFKNNRWYYCCGGDIRQV